MTSERLGLRISPELTAQVTARGNFSEATREILSRYFYLLDRSRRSLRDLLTAAELSLLCDVHSGTIWEPHTLEGVRWSVEDAENDYFERWSVDRTVLLAKLSTLTLTDCAALVDAIERFWRASSTGMAVDPAGILGEDTASVRENLPGSKAL